MNEKWQSNAEWPLDVYRGMYGDGITSDTHRSRDEAQNVCLMLNRDGFGGQGKHFPKRTWVSEVTDTEARR